MAALISGETPFATSLAKLKGITEGQINELLLSVPSEWGLSTAECTALREFILRQREKVGEILEQNRNLFPNWIGGTKP